MDYFGDFHEYANETAAEGKLFNVVLTLRLGVSLSSKDISQIFSTVLQ